ncbi:MAG: cobyrinate a,c-diamide synthase, partial [Halocynthiibacter sp.]
ILIAAAHKSSGKTVVSAGLVAALQAAGTAVQCFKKGPDYIDPMWLAAASGRPCYNLDFNTMTGDELRRLLADRSEGADLALIEANKGLYDGVDLAGCDSNAALAKALKTPVVLVIDTVGMTRGIAPLLLGYQSFDPKVNIAGVILNKVGGARHEAKLRAAVQAYSDIAVIGAVWRHGELEIGERHLGLTTPAETGGLGPMMQSWGRIIGEAVDLDALRTIAAGAPRLVAPPAPPAPSASQPGFAGIRIAIARDAAFGFYYPDDLEEFARLGVELIPFDALTASRLPKAHGLFIGGGFPEIQKAALAKNASLRADIRAAIQGGLPAYAECGGAMYLCRSLSWRDERHDMCGVIDADAVMHERPQGRGYTAYKASAGHPWGAPGEMAGHEFHYASFENLRAGTRFAHQVLRGHGIDGSHDAIVLHNLVAGFGHLRNSTANPWVARFLSFVKACRA